MRVLKRDVAPFRPTVRIPSSSSPLTRPSVRERSRNWSNVKEHKGAKEDSRMGAVRGDLTVETTNGKSNDNGIKMRANILFFARKLEAGAEQEDRYPSNQRSQAEEL